MQKVWYELSIGYRYVERCSFQPAREQCNPIEHYSKNRKSAPAQNRNPNPKIDRTLRPRTEILIQKQAEHSYPETKSQYTKIDRVVIAPQPRTESMNLVKG